MLNNYVTPESSTVSQNCGKFIRRDDLTQLSQFEKFILILLEIFLQTSGTFN